VIYIITVGRWLKRYKQGPYHHWTSGRSWWVVMSRVVVVRGTMELSLSYK